MTSEKPEPDAPEHDAAEAAAETVVGDIEPPGVPVAAAVVVEEDVVATQAAVAAGPGLGAKLGVEALGTFILVLAGVGVALYAQPTGAGPLGVALAFGLAVFAGVAAFGWVSGAHFNPAVTIGAALAGRTPWRDVLPYWLAQVVGGALATTVLFLVANSSPALSEGNTIREFFRSASNGYGELSLGNFGLGGAILIEVVVTAVFVGVILGVTGRGEVRLAAPVIGLTLTVLVLVAIPITNASINPARSTASAIFAGGVPLSQLWVFWVAPLVGAALAGVLYLLFTSPAETTIEEETPVDTVENAADLVGDIITDTPKNPTAT